MEDKDTALTQKTSAPEPAPGEPAAAGQGQDVRNPGNADLQELLELPLDAEGSESLKALRGLLNIC